MRIFGIVIVILALYSGVQAFGVLLEKGFGSTPGEQGYIIGRLTFPTLLLVLGILLIAKRKR